MVEVARTITPGSNSSQPGPYSSPKDDFVSEVSEVGEFVTVKQFCTLFSIARSSAYVQIKAGRLKIQKIGRSTRISRAAILEWLSSGADSG